MATKRLLAVAMAILWTAGVVACGGGSSSPTAASTTPAPTKAQITFNLDPMVQTAEYQGNGWWRFKVNEEYVETGGVGFMINTVRVTVSSPSGTVLYDDEFAVAAHVAAYGREVRQYTSGLYYTNYVTGQATVKMIANITDDKGNSIVLSNSMSVRLHNSEPVRLP